MYSTSNEDTSMVLISMLVILFWSLLTPRSISGGAGFGYGQSTDLHYQEASLNFLVSTIEFSISAPILTFQQN